YDQSLPPYELLDHILQLYVEERLEVSQIVEHGLDRALVNRIIQMVDRAEYKRRQMPVGLRVTSKAFGSGRRLPIAQRWSQQDER
ncbi:MAG TPA: NAD+ synthase, partial [Myxococcales bacterium]|nr:NAD+ synthase [Myxococcales bacterium]